MVFSIAVILLVGAIAYFHYVQGFFSATLSTIITVISAVLTLSYQEKVVNLFNGKFPDVSTALVLCVMFAIIYTILRVIFDSLIPGNVRVPVILDKAGAGVMGIIAGIFAMGIFVIAAESLPFGPSIGGYTRYQLNDRRDVQLPTSRQNVDLYVYNTLKSDTFTPDDKSALILPVDDMLVNIVSHLSDGGSLAGSVNFTQVHPAYLDELFGQRIGIQTGAKHVAVNTERTKDIDIKGLFTVESLPQAEDEVPSIRKSPDFAPLKSDQARAILIVRLNFSHSGSDDDNYVRVSTGAVRLVANGTNYTPIGTLDLTASPLLRVDHPDDFLIVPSDGVVDFVFLVPRSDFGLENNSKDKTGHLELAQNIFIEAKREARIDLDGMQVTAAEPPVVKPAQLRKPGVPKLKA
jgi:hypothetical protein